jgi:hypothetical protein
LRTKPLKKPSKRLRRRGRGKKLKRESVWRKNRRSRG